MESQTINEGKTMAIVSYITVIGLLIAFLVNNSNKNAFTSYHIGQSVRVFLLAIANYILAGLLPGSLSIVTTLIAVGVLVLVILGIINAANGKAVPLPIIGTIG